LEIAESTTDGSSSEQLVLNSVHKGSGS